MSLKSMMQNYKKPTPNKWRRVGDYVLILQVFITGQLPAWSFLPDHTKVIVGSVVNLLGVSIKFWTNTKKDDDSVENTEANKTDGA